MANLILLLLSVGAIFQPDDLSLRPKITGSVALIAVAGVHLWKTFTAGYLPGRATNPRLEHARNIAGAVTLGLVGLDGAAVVGVLVS